MRKSFYAILLLLNFYSINAQTFNIANQVTFGGNNSEFQRCAKKTNDGGFILGGSSTSGISSDKTDYCRGWGDYWLVKFNSSFIPIWQKTIGGNNGEDLLDILILANNELLLIGGSDSPLSGDKTVPNYGSEDFWIIKLDKNQNIVWQKTYGGTTGGQSPVKAFLKNNGDVLIAGVSNSDSSGTKTENSRGGNDYWLIKIDTAGNQLWDKTYGGSDYDFLKDMNVFTNGDILLSGYSYSPSSSDKTEGHFGSIYDTDNWIIKLDSNGNKLWDKTIGGDSMDLGGYVTILNNKIYFASSSNSSASGLKTENCKGGLDYWVIKLDSNSNIIWDKTIGGNKGDGINDITIVNGSKLLLSGSSSSDISGDKNEACRFNNDYWVYSIDTNANYIWQKTIGGHFEDQISNAFEISPNHFILAGTSDSDISGEKTDYCRGNYDYWAVELSVILNNNEQNIYSKFSLTPNPATDYVYINTDKEENFNITIYNILGKKVFENYYYITNNPINITQLNNGIYICEVTTESKVLRRIKFVKN